MVKHEYISDQDPETAVLIGVQSRGVSERETRDSLEELAQLTNSAGARVVECIHLKQDRPNASTFIGKGKAKDIGDKVKEGEVDTVVFDDDLSPAQSRNLEKILKTKIVDRTQMILDIFAQHANTKEGSLQIELAQLEYLLPRLRHMWTHLERQQGGIGLRGPGEKQLEMDRRRIGQQITRLRNGLEDVRSRRAEQRRGRRRHGWALLTFVGYTNAGKSTLLNRLTGADVHAYDQLFATLDPTTRRLKLPNNQMALLTDTVGFIRKLPHHLVEAFKATLEEVVEADLLVHVIDASHPRVEQQIEAVRTVLQELGAEDTPLLAVLNKVDLPEAKNRVNRLSEQLGDAVAVSAKTGEGIDDFAHAVADRLQARSVQCTLRVPLSEGKLLATLRSRGNILSEEYIDGHVDMKARVPHRLMGACEAFRVGQGTDED